jgi:hypothetical protein
MARVLACLLFSRQNANDPAIEPTAQEMGCKALFIGLRGLARVYALMVVESLYRKLN